MAETDRFDVVLTVDIKTTDGKKFSDTVQTWSDMSYKSLAMIEALLIGVLADLNKVAQAKK